MVRSVSGSGADNFDIMAGAEAVNQLGGDSGRAGVVGLDDEISFAERGDGRRVQQLSFASVNIAKDQRPADDELFQL